MPKRGSSPVNKIRKEKPAWVKWTKRILWALSGLFLVLFICGSIYLFLTLRALEGRVIRMPQLIAEIHKDPTVVLADDGTVLYAMSTERREPVSWLEIPQVVKDATIAAEDKRFWEHRGVDFMAITRALWVNFRAGGVRQGGSTITQQIAKRLLTGGERTLHRKIEDACLAILIEKNYTKEQILTLYLNQVFYGSGAYGIKAAAHTYFGKDLDKLTLSEAATLSRIPRRPSDENPFVDPNAAKRNRDIVLDIMLEEKLINREEYEKAKKEDLKLAKAPASQMGIYKAPYFVTHVLDEMRKEFPNDDFSRGGYRIETTLNIKAQEFAEKAVADTVAREKKRKVNEAAIVVMDVSGQILAMVGGSNFKRSQYNVITQGRRQPGSAFKPFVYAAAMEMGLIKPTSLISNEPFVWRDPSTGKIWRPKGGGSGGFVSVQSALTRSINVPAVHVCNMVTPSVAAKMTKDVFGIRTPIDPVLPLVLGSSAVKPLEMLEGYSVFATGGHRVVPYSIKRVIGPDGRVLRDYSPRVVYNVLSSNTALPMRDILRRVVSGGTGRNAAGVVNAGGKTGTTQLHLDAWFCGFTDELVAVAWVANATYDPSRTPPWKYSPMAGVFGGEVAARMWADALKPIQKLINEKPNGVTPKYYGGEELSEEVSVLICMESGDRAIPGKCPKTETKTMQAKQAKEIPTCGLHGSFSDPPPGIDDFPVEGEENPTIPPEQPPPVASTSMVSVEICPESGLVAGTYCPVKRVTKFPAGKEPSKPCNLHVP